MFRLHNIEPTARHGSAAKVDVKNTIPWKNLSSCFFLPGKVTAPPENSKLFRLSLQEFRPDHDIKGIMTMFHKDFLKVSLAKQNMNK